MCVFMRKRERKERRKRKPTGELWWIMSLLRHVVWSTHLHTFISNSSKCAILGISLVFLISVETTLVSLQFDWDLILLRIRESRWKTFSWTDDGGSYLPLMCWSGKVLVLSGTFIDIWVQHDILCETNTSLRRQWVSWSDLNVFFVETGSLWETSEVYPIPKAHTRAIFYTFWVKVV